MADPQEKRRYHRFMALLEVRVLPGERVPPDLKLTTIDIAAGGARCASNRRLDDNLRLQMSFTLVGGDLRQPTTIDVDATVLRCSENPSAPEPRRFALALEFVRVDPQDKRKLVDYLNSL
jgi:c-di-GMP-binding flagellar brake protein YcgR